MGEQSIVNLVNIVKVPSNSLERLVSVFIGRRLRNDVSSLESSERAEAVRLQISNALEFASNIESESEAK